MATEATGAAEGPRKVKGGKVRWAAQCGFPTSTIFPIIPPERSGIRNVFEFQPLMYRPLYWLGTPDGQTGIDFERSLGLPPEWDADGRSVTITVKPWKWSNGETICADNVMLFINVLKAKPHRYCYYTPGCLPDNLTAMEKIAEDQVRLTFDRAYSKTWVLMNQLTLITPMPKAWDRIADDIPANASGDIGDAPAVYEFLAEKNGLPFTNEDHTHRGKWPESPVWSVISGPWRLKSFEIDGTITFVPNEHYSGPDKPYLDEFVEVQTKSDEGQYARMLDGPDAPDALQVGYLPWGLDVDELAARLGDNYRVVPWDIYMIYYLLFNFANPGVPGKIFDQLYFRQALQCTLDQDRVIREVFHGYGTPTTGPIPPMPPSGLLPSEQRYHVRFDIDQARKLLEDNGWDVSQTPAVCVRGGEGPGCAGKGIEAGTRLSFQLRYAEGRPGLVKMLELHLADAAKAGIEVHTHPVNGSVMVGQDHAEIGPDHQHVWELQSWNGGWVFHGLPVGEVSFKTGGASNFGQYSDARADALIEKVMQSDDVETWHEYHEYLAEQQPVVYTPSLPPRLFAVAKNLRGFEPINPYGMLTPENWYYVEED